MATPARTVGPGVRRSSARSGSRRRRSYLKRRRRTAWLFMAPLILVNVIVIVGPSIAALYYSFTNWDGISAAHWTGLTNFRRLLHDGEFRTGLEHNLERTALFLSVPIAMRLLRPFLLSQFTAFP